MMRKLQYILTCVLIMTSLCACEYKDFIEDEGDTVSFNVDFDWQNVDSIPSSMRVVFYPDDAETMAKMTQGYRIFDVQNKITEVFLPTGNYKAIAFNNDTEHLTTEDYGMYGLLYASTINYESRGIYDKPNVIDSIYDFQDIRDYPDYMVQGSQSFSLNLADYDKVLTFTPDSIVTTVNITFNGIGGLSWVRDIRGAIDLTMNKRFLNRDELEEPAVNMFNCEYNDSLVTAKFYVFGMEQSILQYQHKLTLFFWMNQGKVFVPMTLDSERITFYSEEPHRISIGVQMDLDLRDFFAERNGFEIEVDEWEDISIDVGF